MSTLQNSSIVGGYGNEKAVLRARVRALPPHARKKLEYFENLKLEATVRNDAKAECRRQLYHERDNLTLQISSDNDPELLRQRDEIVAQLAAMEQSKAKVIPPRKERQLISIIACQGADPVEWLIAQPSGRTFRKLIPEFGLRDGQTLLDALTENRAAQFDFADQIRLAERASLDFASVLAGVQRDIAELAAKGKPDVRGLLRVSESNNSGGSFLKATERLTQGHVEWPTDSLVIPLPESLGIVPQIHALPMGSAMLAWLFPKELETALIAELRTNFDPDNSLTFEERKIRVGECEAKILELQRLEEQILVRLESQGLTGMRTGSLRNPLAVLEIEPET
jgi:hypothetical protein